MFINQHNSAATEAQQLQNLLLEKIIPWVQLQGMANVFTACPSWQAFQKADPALPDGATITRKPLESKPIRGRNLRTYGNTGIEEYRWPKDKLLSARVPKLCFVMEGPVAFQIADYVLHCSPGPIGMNDSLRWNGDPYVIRPETDDIVLGKYERTDQAGAVLRTRDGLTQIILGRPGAISPQFIRNLAGQAGITPFSESNDEMRFGSGILAFYAERGGTRDITLPAGMKVVVSLTGTEYKITKNGFTFQIGYSDIAVFKISNR